MKKDLKKMKKWVMKNKFLSVLIFIGIIFIGYFSLMFLTAISFSSTAGAMYESMDRSYYPSANIGAGLKSSMDMVEESGWSSSSPQLQENEYQIKEGSATIETQNSEGDYQRVKSKGESYDGWVDSVRHSENYRTKTVHATIKVPSENFDEYADWIIENFEVTNSNIKLYRTSVERQQDEIDILEETLDAYDNLFFEASQMNVSVNSINLMETLTQKKLYIMRQMRDYGYSVKNVQEKSAYSTLSLTLTEKKDIELFPDDLGRDLMEKLREAIRNITSALMDLITVPFVIFVTIIVWIIYALVVLIPLFLSYKLCVRIFKWLDKKIK